MIIIIFIYIGFNFGAFVIYSLWRRYSEEQILQVEPDGLLVLSPKNIFQKRILILKENLIAVKLGMWSDESFLSLRIIQKPSCLNKWVSIAPLLHKTEKKIIYYEIVDFLLKHDFDFEYSEPFEP